MSDQDELTDEVKRMNGRFVSGSAKLTLQEWLQERHDNCLRHAENKTGWDK